MGVDGGEGFGAGGVHELSVEEELGGEADVHLVHVHLLRTVI